MSFSCWSWGPACLLPDLWWCPFKTCDDAHVARVKKRQVERQCLCMLWRVWLDLVKILIANSFTSLSTESLLSPLFMFMFLKMLELQFRCGSIISFTSKTFSFMIESAVIAFSMVIKKNVVDLLNWFDSMKRGYSYSAISEVRLSATLQLATWLFFWAGTPSAN